MSSTKVVQTELDIETYNILKAIAVSTGVPLKEVLRDALKEYAEERKRDILKRIHDDPMWKGIGLLKVPADDWSERDEWDVVEWESE